MQNDKYFIITIDTEGDNLWDWKLGDTVTTENVNYLKRFQSLANDYSFKPVWLSNYEMMNDDRYIEFISSVEASGLGEVGMHLHAWNNPPYYKLEKVNAGAPYLIEYPVSVMEDKIAYITDYIKKRTGITPISHRAGRWAMNRDYYNLLIKYGYKIDCSVTPHIDWSASVGMTKNSMGSNYSDCAETAYWIYGSSGERILEVPMTIRCNRFFKKPDSLQPISLLKEIYHSVKPRTVWLRPDGCNQQEMLSIIDNESKQDGDYLMFMIHSSELMPGGSLTFKNTDDIENLYYTMEKVFMVAAEKFKGCTLREYYARKRI